MFTLKNIKVHNDMSEETLCFSATIYVGKKLAGTVKNEGRGGCNFYWWEDRALGKQIEEWANQQKTRSQYEKLDEIVSRMLDRDEVSKQLTKWAKKGTHFRLKGDKPGEWRKVQVGGKMAPYTPAVKAWLEKRSEERRVGKECRSRWSPYH